MSSRTDVANLGLVALGGEEIVDIDQANTNARRCKAVMDTVLDIVLGAHPWHFAKTDAQLAADATAPMFTWGKRYALPTDCVRLLEVKNEVPAKYELRGRYIHCDYEAPLNIVYIARVDISIWSPQAVSAAGYRLAQQIAFPITNSRDAVKEMAALYDRELRDARSINAQQVPEPESEDEPSSILASR